MRFLDTRHGDNYKVYNLCSERQYEPSVFHGRACRYPFDDHNCPPLSLIYECCQDLSDFLKADDKNVVALHCKAGKGRTGLMICCFLLWNNDWDTAESALSFYGAARTHNQKGVTIPSQIRYVNYFDRALHRSVGPTNVVPPQKLLMLQGLVLRNFPSQAAGAEASVKIRAHGKTTVPSTVLAWKGAPGIISSQKNICDLSLALPTLPLRGDIHVRVDTKSGSFMFWFNTFFYDQKLQLTKPEIDKAAKDKSLSADFSVEMTFSAEEDTAAAAALQRHGVAQVGIKKLAYRFPESLMCL